MVFSLLFLFTFSCISSVSLAFEPKEREKDDVQSSMQNAAIITSTTSVPPLKDVVFAEGKFVGFSPSFLYLSSDGENWIQQFEPQLTGDKIYYKGGRYFIIGENKLHISRNTVNWFETKLEGEGKWNDLTYGDGEYILVGDKGKIARSYNAIDFETEEEKGGLNFNQIDFLDGEFIVHAESKIYRIDTDSLNPEEIIIEGESNKLKDFCIHDNTIIAVDTKGSLLKYNLQEANSQIIQHSFGDKFKRIFKIANSIYVTSNKSIYELKKEKESFKLKLMHENDASRYEPNISSVAGNKEMLIISDYLNSGLYKYKNGTWYDLTKEQRGYFKSIVFNRSIGFGHNESDLYVAVGADVLAYSQNGLSWEFDYDAFKKGDTQYKVIWNAEKGEFLSVGKNGSIYKSKSGKEWNRIKSTTNENLSDVIWISERGVYVVVGENNTLLKSPNGEDWESVKNLPTTNTNFIGITYDYDASDNVRVFVAGDKSVILKSKNDLSKWYNIDLPDDFKLNFNSIQAVNLRPDFGEALNAARKHGFDPNNFAIPSKTHTFFIKHDLYEKRLSVGSNKGAIISDDYGETWERISEEISDEKIEVLVQDNDLFLINKNLIYKITRNEELITRNEEFEPAYDIFDFSVMDSIWASSGSYYLVLKEFAPPKFLSRFDTLLAEESGKLKISPEIFDSMNHRNLDQVKIELYDNDMNQIGSRIIKFNEENLKNREWKTIFEEVPKNVGYRLNIILSNDVPLATPIPTSILGDNFGGLDSNIEKYLSDETQIDEETVTSAIRKILQNDKAFLGRDLSLDLLKKVFHGIDKVLDSDKSFENIYDAVRNLVNDVNYNNSMFKPELEVNNGIKNSKISNANIEDLVIKLNDIIYNSHELKQNLKYTNLDFEVEPTIYLNSKTGDENIKTSTTNLNFEAVKALTDRNIKRAVLMTDLADVSVVPNDIISDNEDIELKIRSIAKTEMEQFNLEEVSAYEFKINQDQKSIPEFPNKLHISIPYEVKEGVNPETLTVFYLDEDGNKKNMGGFYDKSSKRISFMTDHLSLFFITVNSSNFSDNNVDWAKRFVNSLAARGIVQGRDDNKFEPNNNLTRAEFITMICNSFNLPIIEYEGNFQDVNNDDWYANFIATGFEHNIISGMPDGKFLPNAPITREQVATIVTNIMREYLRIQRLNSSKFLESLYNDHHQISDYARDSVFSAYKYGVLRGSGQNFAPKSNTTRAEAAVVIYKLLEMR